MGFNNAKSKVLNCLKAGAVLHEQRGNIDTKNLLATGEVTLDDVSEVIRRARGNQHNASRHHVMEEVWVHTIKAVHAGSYWYIKWYFVEPNSVFISVHH